MRSSRPSNSRSAEYDAERVSRMPILATFPGCCALAYKQTAKSRTQRVRTAIFFFMSFAVSNVEPLLNDFIRPRQHVRWNRQADLLRRFEIDDQIEFRSE